jgi:ATP-binding cassette subfamily B protein
MSCRAHRATRRWRGLPTAQWPDVLLCDIVLRGEQDGYNVLRLIREEEASRAATLMERMPAIALTGHAQADVWHSRNFSHASVGPKSA